MYLCVTLLTRYNNIDILHISICTRVTSTKLRIFLRNNLPTFHPGQPASHDSCRQISPQPDEGIRFLDWARHPHVMIIVLQRCVTQKCQIALDY
jgi:hypothetical protein